MSVIRPANQSVSYFREAEPDSPKKWSSSSEFHKLRLANIVEKTIQKLGRPKKADNDVWLKLHPDSKFRAIDYQHSVSAISVGSLTREETGRTLNLQTKVSGGFT